MPAPHKLLTRRLALWLGVAGGGVVLAFLGALGASAVGTWLGLAGLALGLAGLAGGHAAVGRHARALERLRLALLASTAEEELGRPPRRPAGSDGEVRQLHEALARFIEHRRERATETDRRMAQILAALGDALVVVAGNRRVGLVNREARELLGSERVAVGTSVFAALEPKALDEALAAAHERRDAVDAELVTHDGRRLQARITPLDSGAAAISIPYAGATPATDCDYNLLLLDPLPTAPHATADTPLAELAVLVLDTETTGLDTTGDDIVAVGAVRMHGARVHPGVNVDRLVNPGRPVPTTATAIHGIDDSMLEGAPRFDAVWPELREIMADCVLVGHNIDFDTAHLQRALATIDPEWGVPPCLDTVLLNAALDVSSASATDGRLDLDALAGRYGIEIHGRHTALGDALATAELYAHLLPLLADAGVHTLGEALELQDTRRSLLMQQRQLGWHDTPEAEA